MAGEQPATDKILVALAKESAFVKVNGRGSFKVSTPLKEFGIAVMGMDVNRILFDMSACIGMDSTFMGTIAGLALRLRKSRSDGSVILFNLSSKTDELLKTLGLDQIILPYLKGNTPAEVTALLQRDNGYETLIQRPETELETTKTMLDPHEKLIDIAPENLSKFRDVLDFLREDLRRGTKD